MHVPEVMKSMFRERPLLNGEVAVQLTRTIRWTMDSVSIADQITGEIAGKELVVGTRLLNNCKVRADGLTLGKRLRGWSSDGLQEIQLYGTSCSGTECRYEIILDL
jgi:L-rhamnose isomerase